MELVSYRDAGMHTYTLFWVHNDKIVSPYFDCAEDAQKWLDTSWDNWKASKDVIR